MCGAAKRNSAASACQLAEILLPWPRNVRVLNGFFQLGADTPLRHETALEPAELAAISRFRKQCGGLSRARPEPRTRSIVLEVAAESQSGQTGPNELTSCGAVGPRAAQGYHLRIMPERVELAGRSSAGLSYGLQTLAQIAVGCGQSWPCVEIEDEPDFAVRGLSYDVSRGRVPTLETLKELAGRLASLKVNHLQLYVEHTFAFRFHQNIGRDCSPLTADEIRELDAYCAERRIELVPSLASFGHMGFVLSLPEYRHLAEVETSKGWWEMGWTERMRGLTLDVTSAESRELLEKMYDEFLPLFSSGLMNVCCDETYDLGKGKSRPRAEEGGVGALYLEHLDFLAQLCRRHGKRLMFWGDIIKKYPELIERVPKDAIVFNWGYAPEADYDSTALFTDAGLTTIVCPGTAGWNHVVNDINAAELNIRRYAAAGKKYGATGLVNTEWGDEGHVNQLAGAWHPIALGAAMAWNSAAPSPEVFDRAFGKLFLDDATGEVVARLREVAAAADMSRNWPEFCKPLGETVPRDILSDEALVKWRSVSAAAAEEFARVRPGDDRAGRDMRELTVACRLAALLGERFEISRALVARDDVADAELARRLESFADACDRIVPEYEAVWLARNKRSCLHEVTRVFDRHSAAARELAERGRNP